MTDISTVSIVIYSTPGVVVPRRLQVSHDHAHVSHVTSVAQYKDNKVAMTTKPYKYTDKKEPDNSNSNSVPMDTADIDCAESNDYDDVCYDGQSMSIIFSVIFSVLVCIDMPFRLY